MTSNGHAHDERALVRAALARLEIDRLTLTVHDASFPAGVDDVGRGTPYTRAAYAFFDFVAARGFTGVQLGPQGKTSLVNASPYDGALMARTHLSVALGPLVDGAGLAGLVDHDELARAVGARLQGSEARAQHRHAWTVLAGALGRAHRRALDAPARFPRLAEAAPAFLAGNADWLEADALFEILTRVHGTDDFVAWPALDRHLYWPRADAHAAAGARRRQLLQAHAELAAFNQFVQLVLHLQHQDLRAHLRTRGLALWADLHVGLAPRDRWRHEGLFLPGHAIGAPPSRTNPEGQAWGYPVLDPFGYWPQGGAAGGVAPALQMFDRRIARLLADFDGVRIDHPHGFICPWVYRTDCADDPLRAVRAGARLFASPNLPDHPELARYAIATAADLAPAGERPRYADDWVRRLDESQRARYALVFDRLMAIARDRGIGRDDVCAEVLSTCPFPVAEVLARHGLGRLRVVQKADPDDERDPYRTARAAPADWVTLGTHDTAPIARVIDGWRAAPARLGAWARYLAARLRLPPEAAAALAQDRGRLVTALAADLFVGPAQHVSLFFADLFGLDESYNVPGTVSDANWSLRVPADPEAHLRAARARGAAPDLPRALALALRARSDADGDATDLAQALERLS